jgi:hypothetical protein
MKTRRGGFWNDLASESEITKSGRRIHRSRSYRRARRDSSRKKWMSRAKKTALAAAALGLGYYGFKNRDAIGTGYNNALSGLNQGYADAKTRVLGAYDEATGLAGDQLARFRGMPTREEIALENNYQAAKERQEAEEAEMARLAFDERQGRRNSLYGHFKRTRRGTKHFIQDNGPGALQGAANFGMGAANVGMGAARGLAGVGSGLLNGVAGIGSSVLGGVAQHGPGALQAVGNGVGSGLQSGLGLVDQGLRYAGNGLVNYGPGVAQSIGTGIGAAGNVVGTGIGMAGNAMGNALVTGASGAADSAAQAYAALAARKAAFDASRQNINRRALPPTRGTLNRPPELTLPAPVDPTPIDILPSLIGSIKVQGAKPRDPNEPKIVLSRY